MVPAMISPFSPVFQGNDLGDAGTVALASLLRLSSKVLAAWSAKGWSEYLSLYTCIYLYISLLCIYIYIWIHRWYPDLKNGCVLATFYLTFQFFRPTVCRWLRFKSLGELTMMVRTWGTNRGDGKNRSIHRDLEISIGINRGFYRFPIFWWDKNISKHPIRLKLTPRFFQCRMVTSCPNLEVLRLRNIGITDGGYSGYSRDFW